VFTEILAVESRWAEIDAQEPDSASDVANDGRALSAEYRKLPRETLTIPDGPVTLPMKRGRFAGTPMIPVTVNGDRRWFWIDTGARLTVLSSDVARKAGVTPLGGDSAQAGTVTARSVAVRPAVIHEFNLGGVRFRNHPAVIIRKEDLRFKLFGLITLLKIDGILGWNALAQLDVEIDYAKPRVVLRRPVRDKTVSRNLFWLGEPLVRGIGPDGIGFVLSLDTGSRHSFGMPELLRKTKARVEGVRVECVGGAGGSDRMKVRKIAPVEARISDCAVRLSEVREEWRSERLVSLDGFVGIDLMDHGWIRLDATNGRFECRLRP
jgi:hypothetical protein